MSQRPFAIYRLPFANECTLVMQRSAEVETFASIADLEGKRGFVMIPFTKSESWRTVLIRPDEIRTFTLGDYVAEEWKALDEIGLFEAEECCESAVGTEVPNNVAVNDSKEIYNNAFEKFLCSLKTRMFEKLVLSRYKDVGFEGNVFDLFRKACAQYPRMMVYLCSAPECGTWLGCTPEILISGSKSHYRTVALAGTMPLDSGEEWSAKNRLEQKIVANYVRNIITPCSSVVEEEGPYTSRAGELVHLKTHFHFSPLPDVSVAMLVEQLHPTPAVCGMPKKDAYRFIMENEGYERGYYAGVVGMFDPAGKTDLYVNLRCTNILVSSQSESTDNHVSSDSKCTNNYVSSVARLYAGGGILPASNVDMEWDETEEKMKTVGALLL